MAGFEDNPFADPKQINPFADPSVQQAAEPKPPAEEYNPFTDQASADPEPPKLPPPPTKAEIKKKEKEKKSKKKPEGPKRPNNSFAEAPPAVLQPEPFEPPPTYQPAPQQFGGADDHIRQREDELVKREAELRDREKNLQKLGTQARPKNFPPLPKFCPCQPCMYINITEEIPPGERWKVRIVVALLAYYFVMLVLNLIMSFAGAVAFGPPMPGQTATFVGTQAAITIVFGFILVLVGPLLALFCWFFPLYYAYRKDSSLAFMWFFFILPAQCLFWLLYALGISGFTCGFVSGASLFPYTNGSVIGGMWIAMGFLWLIPIPVSAFLIFTVHRYYRTSGGSINKAMGEAVTGAAKNEAVRGAVKQSVKAGVNAAMEKD